MILTDKCKEAFDKWYVPYIRKHPFVGDKYFDDTLIDQFYEWTDSMQFGVYVDFFDSVGIYIRTNKCYVSNNDWSYTIDSDTNCIKVVANIKTRTEARTKAIEKANEIYNNY